MTTPSDSLICGSCRRPIHPSESGLRHFGTHTSHSANRCIEILQLEIDGKVSDLAAAQEANAKLREELQIAVDRFTRASGDLAAYANEAKRVLP